MSESSLVFIRALYLGGSLGVLVFLLLWEDGQPRSSLPIGLNWWTHAKRNFGIFVWLVLIADYVVGQWVLGSDSLLLTPPRFALSLADRPVGFQILIAVLASDLLDYLLHRMSHRFSWLWRIHSVHHSDPHLDATTALREHPLETSLNVTSKVALYAVLGLPLWIEGLRAILHNTWTMVQHANVMFPTWVERLRVILLTPALHRLHHDSQRRVHDNNYGFIFSFWDRWFGSYLPPEEAQPDRIGLRGYEGDSWQSVTGMLLTPARRPPQA